MWKLATKFNYLFKFLVVGICIAILISSYCNACNKIIIEGLSRKKKNAVKDKLIAAIDSGNIDSLNSAIRYAQKKEFKTTLLKDAWEKKRKLEKILGELEKILDEMEKVMKSNNVEVIEKKIGEAENKIDGAKYEGLDSHILKKAETIMDELIVKKKEVIEIRDVEKKKKQELEEEKKKNQKMSKSINKFKSKHRNFLSNKIRRNTCDLLYGDHSYGLFSFIKNNTNYQNSTRVQRRRRRNRRWRIMRRNKKKMTHFVPGCGFYGCSVGGLKNNKIIFENGNNITKRLAQDKYKGPETFYFLLYKNNDTKKPVEYGDTVQLVSKTTNNKHKCILVNPNPNTSEKRIKYNSVVELKSDEYNFSEKIMILAAPYSKNVKRMTCGENSDVGNIEIDDQGGISGNNIPSSMREMFLS